MKFQPLHKTKDGRTIPIREMSDRHLLNTIALIERRAQEGIEITVGGGGVDPEDFWYEEEIIFGEEAKARLNFAAYQAEAKRRFKAQ